MTTLKFKFIFLALVSSALFANAQLKGKVVAAADSTALSGVIININGKKGNVISSANGEFIIPVANGTYLLEFSMLGFAPQEIKVTVPFNGSILVALKSTALDVEEVIINTGYQRLPKERATGSFTLIDNKTLSQQFGSDILSRLEAVTNGLTVDRRSAGESNIMIRGLSTINGPRQPLIILDNFPYQGDINNINPNDVESISVLKDAAAASIWGARAGNGVVVITTKRAKQNQPLTIDFSSNFTIGSKPNLYYLPQITSSDYIDVETMLYEKGFFTASVNDALKPPLSPVVELLAAKTKGLISTQQANDAINSLRQQDVRNDLLRYSYRRPVNRQSSLSLRGSSDKYLYGLSVGYDNNISELDAGYSRLSLVSRNTAVISEKLKLEGTLGYTASKNRGGNSGINDIKNGKGALYPYTMLADEQGNALPVAKNYSLSYLNSLSSSNLLDWRYYPLSESAQTHSNSDLSDLLANISIKYQPWSWLKAEVLYQYELQQSNGSTLSDAGSFAARNMVNTFTQINSSTGEVSYKVPQGGILSSSENKLKAQNLRSQLSFDRSHGRSEISVLAGGELQEAKGTGSSGTVYGYDENLTFINVDFVNQYPTYVTGQLSNISPGSQGFSDKVNRFVSVFANGAYTWNHRYTATLSARKDASNVFGLKANEKWEPLWSAGLAWKISEENFFKNNILSFLKLRATYGFSGNVDPGRTALTTLSRGLPSDYTFSPTARFSQFSNPELRWEKVGTTNLGLDFGFYGGRIKGSLEVYQKNAKDLYGSVPVDFTAVPSATLVKNVAHIRAKGLDFALTTINLDREFKWVTDLNFNLYRDKVINYYSSSVQGSTFVGDGNRINALIGRPVYSVYSYRSAGLDPANGNPLGYLNGSPSSDYNAITAGGTSVSDLIYHGSAMPTLFGSLGNTFRYRNFSLSARISYKFGYYFRRESINYSLLFNSAQGHSDFQKRWQKPGDEAFTSIPSMVYPANARRDALYTNSPGLVEKGDHIRIAFITANYTLNRKQLKKLPFEFLQFQLNVTNPGIIWSKTKSGVDPDYRSSAIPQTTYFSAGISTSFK